MARIANQLEPCGGASTPTRSPDCSRQITRPLTTTAVPSLGRWTTISYTQSAESITGRTVSVWGLSGTTTNACRCFRMIGPPAERQCAVEPTGVPTIKPSQLYVVTKSEST